MIKEIYKENFRDRMKKELKSKRLKQVASWTANATTTRIGIQSSDNRMNKWKAMNLN